MILSAHTESTRAESIILSVAVQNNNKLEAAAKNVATMAAAEAKVAVVMV